MNTSGNNYDAIEALIFQEGLRIQAVDIHPELNILLVILNTQAVLRLQLSAYKQLHKADHAALLQYELIADGTGIHWPLLDEDLSLKGFLQETLRMAVGNPANQAA